MDIYREEILEHYKNPHNFGDFDEPSVQAREANASCGDLIELQLVIEDSRVSDARFKGVGCALSVAAASLLTDELKGLGLDEAKALDEDFILGLMGIEVGSMRMKCISLPLRALNKALGKK